MTAQRRVGNQADALAQITDSMAREDAMPRDNTLYSIGQFKYANGYQEDVSHYIVVVTYQRVFKIGLQDISNAAIDKTPNSGNPVGLIATGVLAFKYGEFAAKDWIDEALSFRFLRTENGWLLQQPVGDPSIVASHIKPKPPAASAPIANTPPRWTRSELLLAATPPKQCTR